MKKITKKTIQLAGAAAVALVVTQSLQSAQLVGAIGFGGNVTWDTESAATATEVTGWLDTQVISDTGTFASFITPIAPVLFSSTTWHLNDPSTAIANFWQAGGFTFTLDSSAIVTQGGTPGVNGYVVVDGTGMVSGNGFSATTINWVFNSQDPKSGTNPDQWTFSASSIGAAVPDGASTILLLGLALSGLALLKRKLAA
jgi:hypothetical protein